jgi:hypothetical protein
MTKSSNKNSLKSSAHVTVKTVYHSSYSIAATSTFTSLGFMTPTPAGLWGALQNVVNLGDMFRLFKINSVDFTLIPVIPNGTTASSYIAIPPSLLYLVPYAAADPADISGVENFPCGKPSAGFLVCASHVSSTVLMKDHAPTLSLKHADLPIINGADPPGWLATAGDGAQTHLGTLVRVAVAAGIAVSSFANVNWILRSELDISFRDIVDPTLLSRVLDASRSPAVSLAPGVLQGMAAAATKVPRLLCSSSINPTTKTCVD